MIFIEFTEIVETEFSLEIVHTSVVWTVEIFELTHNLIFHVFFIDFFQIAANVAIVAKINYN